jgi:creatinine amidohydrolase/Fe(II)-dependent formamide hydrolase-like protein
MGIYVPDVTQKIGFEAFLIIISHGGEISNDSNVGE